MVKKGGKKKDAKIDGIDTTRLSRRQLQVLALRIKEANEREREERNYFQLERDKIRTFWDVTRHELEETTSKLRNRETQMERERRAMDERVNFYEQKTKHVALELESKLALDKAKKMKEMQKVQDDLAARENALLDDKSQLKTKESEWREAHQEEIKCLKTKHCQDVHEMEEEFGARVREIRLRYDKRLSLLEKRLADKHRMELGQTDESAKLGMAKMIEQHDWQFNDMKEKYNDMTINNLGLIGKLNEQMKQLRKENQAMASQISVLTCENRRMTEPLRKAHTEMERYKKMLQRHDKDKTYIQNLKKTIEHGQVELHDEIFSGEALEMAYESLKIKHDQLKKNYYESLLETQYKTAFKETLLNKKVENLVENKAFDNNTAKTFTFYKDDESTKSDDENLNLQVTRRQDQIIKNLEYQLAKVCKAHDDMLATYEEKLHAFGIPRAELGFKPLRFVNGLSKGVGRAPAGLVTQNK